MPSKAKQLGQPERRGNSTALLCSSNSHSHRVQPLSRVSSTGRGHSAWKCASVREQGPLIYPASQRPELLRCTSHKLAISSTPPFGPDLPRSSFLPLLTHQGASSSEHILNSMSLHLENSDGHILYHPYQLPCLSQCHLSHQITVQFKTPQWFLNIVTSIYLYPCLFSYLLWLLIRF